MDDFSASLVRFITLHAIWAGPLIGCLAFLESLIVVGLFIPAIAIMVTTGGLIGAGIVDPLPVFAFGVVGAVLGDWVSFAIGSAIGPAVYRHRWLRSHRLAFARARLFFRRHGFVSVFIGRFLGPIRPTVPVVAGVMGMPVRMFQLANILSALLWVPALLLPGYLAGQRLISVELLRSEHILLLGCALALGPLLIGWLVVRSIARPRRRGK